MNVVRKMGTTSLHVTQDIFSGKAEIVFDRDGQRYIFRCDRYQDALDNMRAAQLTITYLWRALEEYGVQSETEDFGQLFSQFFLGFSVMPDDSTLLLSDGSQEWHEVLGIEPDAEKVAIINAYRALARIYHPDAGGDPAMFRRLREAYEEGMEQWN